MTFDLQTLNGDACANWSRVLGPHAQHNAGSRPPTNTHRPHFGGILDLLGVRSGSYSHHHSYTMARTRGTVTQSHHPAAFNTTANSADERQLAQAQQPLAMHGAELVRPGGRRLRATTSSMWVCPPERAPGHRRSASGGVRRPHSPRTAAAAPPHTQAHGTPHLSVRAHAHTLAVYL